VVCARPLRYLRADKGRVVVPRVSVSIAVQEDHLGRFTEVVKAVEKAGLKTESAFGSIGVVKGSLDVDKVEDLRRVPGVANVEKSGRYQIRPPRDDIQ
jgi:hypothetical protein